jgi:predicted HAD superfamily phosphohydrolase YqeG
MSETIKLPRPTEGLTWKKLARFFCLAFSPKRVKPYLAIRRLEDVSPARLQAAGIEGVLVDADGTLCPNHARVFPESAVHYVLALRAAGLKVAIYSNCVADRYSQFGGVPVVLEAEAKPDPRGFLRAMQNYLHLDDPAKICMIGDNFLTDGGAIDAGMRFIHVQPVPGVENRIHRLTRWWALACARRFWPQAFSDADKIFP